MLQLYLTLVEDGEVGKLEALYREYKSKMLSKAYSVLRDEGLAEDAVHNAFMRILKNLDKIDEVKSSRTRGFVLVITANVAKSMYTREKRVTVVELDETLPEPTDVETQTERRLTAELIAEKIAALPESYSSVTMLRYRNGLSDGEIASALSLSPSTVRKRLERGRKKLSELLGGTIDG